jgi:hypothetical protein
VESIAVNRLWERAREKLGSPALVSATLYVASLAVYVFGVYPLQERARQLGLENAPATPVIESTRDYLAKAVAASPENLAALPRFLPRQESLVDRLAKLDETARTSGLTLPRAEYRYAEPQPQLERYEIVLPVTGSYIQVRTFIANALAGIPMLSLDQVHFRRKTVGDGRVETEMKFTLHMVTE